MAKRIVKFLFMKRPEIINRIQETTHRIAPETRQTIIPYRLEQAHEEHKSNIRKRTDK